MSPAKPGWNELVADPEFNWESRGTRFLHWQLSPESRGVETRTGREGGLVVSAPRAARLVLRNGNWGSRLFIPAEQSCEICVFYRSPVELVLEVGREGAAQAVHRERLPASRGLHEFRAKLPAGACQPGRPHFVELTASLPADAEIEIRRVSIGCPRTQDLPRVAVAIVTYNRRGEILRLLEQISRMDYPSERVQVVVVDNASPDDTRAAIRAEHPWVALLENPENLGGSGGFNRFFLHLRELPDAPPLAWLVDDDAHIAPNTLSELVRALSRDESVAIAGSVMMDLERPLEAYEAGGQLDPHRFGWQANRLGVPLQALRDRQEATREVGYAGAYSLLFRTELLARAGIWRDYFLHLDDSEWCYRVRERTGGKVVIAHDSLVWHVLQGARKPFTELRFYETRNFLNFSSCYGSRLALLQVLAQCVGMAVVQLLARRRDLFAFHLRGIQRFFRGPYGREALERTAGAARDLKDVLSHYRELRGRDPRRVFVVVEFDAYIGDGTGHDAKLIAEVRALLPDAEIVAVGQEAQTGSLAGADRTLRLDMHRSRTGLRLEQLRRLLMPSRGLVILPFWNQSVIPNNLGDLAAVYESGQFSLYPADRRALAQELAKLAVLVPFWALRVLAGRYDPRAADVESQPSPR